MIKTFLLSIVFFVLFATTVKSTDFPFANGEYGKYGVYYNWNFIWVYSGNIEFFTSQEKYKGLDCWHFQAFGKTFMPYDLLYKVRDTFNVYTTYDDLTPLYFRRAMNHGRKVSIHSYYFNKHEQTIQSAIDYDGQVFYKTFSTANDVNDLLSSAYKFRQLDFRKYKLYQRVSYRMLIDDTFEDLYFHYLGTEIIKTRNERKFRCHVISVALVKGDFFNEGEYMKVWFTDDENKVPIQVETKILVGSLKVVLLETKSLKFRLESEIN